MQKVTALSKIFSIAGFDESVAYLFIRHGWRTVSVPITLFLVTTYFTKDFQGYYFTFMSLVSLQVLIEIGFGTVLIQFVSHEWAHLKLSNAGEIIGDRSAASRLSSLNKMAWRWYIAMAFLFFIFNILYRNLPIICSES